mgnify:FL=1
MSNMDLVGRCGLYCGAVDLFANGHTALAM